MQKNKSHYVDKKVSKCIQNFTPSLTPCLTPSRVFYCRQMAYIQTENFSGIARTCLELSSPCACTKQIYEPYKRGDLKPQGCCPEKKQPHRYQSISPSIAPSTAPRSSPQITPQEDLSEIAPGSGSGQVQILTWGCQNQLGFHNPPIDPILIGKLLARAFQ